MGTYKRGLLPPLFPLVPGKFFPPPLLTSLCLLPPFPSHDSCSFLREKREEVYIHILHQTISPLSEGNLVDLDLGVLGVLLVLPLIFLHSFVALVVFESEGVEHFVCSFHCILCIGLNSL